MKCAFYSIMNILKHVELNNRFLIILLLRDNSLVYSKPFFRLYSYNNFLIRFLGLYIQDSGIVKFKKT